MGPYNGGGDGLTLVMKDEKSGYVNKNGEVIIPIEYDELSSFNEGIAVAKTGDKVQFIDLQGQSVTRAFIMMLGSFPTASLLIKSEKNGDM